MNAAADRLDDTFPHGTAEGYKAGCRGTVCPGADDYGLSCKRANQLAAGDYRYQKLIKKGLGPGEIALELGLVPEGPTAPVIAPKPAKPAKTTQTAVEVTATPIPRAATPTAPTPLTLADFTAGLTVAAARERGRIIRTWLRNNGWPTLPARGPIPPTALAAYAAAAPTDDERVAVSEAQADISEHGPVVTAGDLDAWAEDHPDRPITGIIDQIDELRIRMSDLSRIDLVADETALDGATTAPPLGVSVSTPGEFAARWNALSDAERATWVTSTRQTLDQAQRCTAEDHASLVTLRDTRPEWSTVATSADLERAIAQRDQARRFAEDSLAELAHAAEREEAGLAFVLEKWQAEYRAGEALSRRVLALTNELDAVRDVERELQRALAEVDRLRLVHAGQARLATMAVFMADLDGTGEDIAAFRAEYDRQHAAKVLRDAADRAPDGFPRGAKRLQPADVSSWLRADADKLTDHENVKSER